MRREFAWRLGEARALQLRDAAEANWVTERLRQRRTFLQSQDEGSFRNSRNLFLARNVTIAVEQLNAQGLFSSTMVAPKFCNKIP